MLSLNSKHVQHVKINLAYNFKVNLITHLEVIALFSLVPFGQVVSEEKIKI
jgi:energy-converting hydrogenase Eha subunit E